MNSTVESYEQAVAGHSWWVPDERRGNVVKAFVVLASGYEPGEQLAEAIKAFVRERLSAYAYPRIIEFTAELPKTLTGKIRRIELRERSRQAASTASASSTAGLLNRFCLAR